MALKMECLTSTLHEPHLVLACEKLYIFSILSMYRPSLSVSVLLEPVAKASD